MKSRKFDVQFTRTADSFWAWVVCIASFFLQFLVGGISNSFGSFFVALLNKFKRSEAETAWIGSLAVGLTYLCGPVSTSLCRRYGCRVVACTGSVLFMVAAFLTSIVPDMMLMYLTFGVLGGISLSMMYFSSLVVLIEYFNKHLSLANGIAVSGTGTGTLVVSLVTNAICSRYGLRMGYRSLACLCVIGFLAGLTYSPISNDVEKSSENGSRKKTSKTSVTKTSVTKTSVTRTIKTFFTPGLQWKNKAFIVWTCSLSLVLFAYYIPYMYLVRVASLNGVPSSKGALLVGFLAIAQTVGKIVFGKLADVPRINRLLLMQVSLLVIAVATCLFPLATSYSSLVTYAVVQGFFDGGFGVMIGLVTHDIVGKPLMAGAVGSMYAVVAVPMTVGPPVAGFIYDFLGSYDTVYFMASAMVCTGLCLMFLIPLLTKMDSNEAGKRVLVPMTNDFPLDDGKDSMMSSLDEDKLAYLLGKKTAADLLLERNRSLLDHSLSGNNTRPSSFVLFSIVTDDNYRDVSTYTSRADLSHVIEMNSPRVGGTPNSRRRFFNAEHNLSTYSIQSLTRPALLESCAHIHVLDSTIAETVEPSPEPSPEHSAISLTVSNELSPREGDTPSELANQEVELGNVYSSCLYVNDGFREDDKRLSNTSWTSANSSDSLKSLSQQSTATTDSGFDEESAARGMELFTGESTSSEAESNDESIALNNTSSTADYNVENNVVNENEVRYGLSAEFRYFQKPINNRGNSIDYIPEITNLKSEMLFADIVPDSRIEHRSLIQSNVSIATDANCGAENLDYYSVMLDNDLECLQDISASVYSLNNGISMPDMLGSHMDNFTETVV